MAMIDHIEWRKTFIDAILLMDQQRFPLPESDLKRLALGASESRLGRWYQDSSRQLEAFASYRELGEAHHGVHACAIACMDEALAGAPIDQLLQQLQQLSKISAVLIAKLQELEITLLKAGATIGDIEQPFISSRCRTAWRSS